MAETFPQYLIENAQRYGERVALREKEFGIWQNITWREYADHVKHFSLGLSALGIQRGERLAIIGDNRPEWLYAELGTQAAGGIPIGIYQDSIADEVLYILNEALVRFVVVEDQEQVDKLIEVWDKLRCVEKVIFYDAKGLRHYQEPYLMAFDAVEALGKQQDSAIFEQNLAQGLGQDVAIFSATSGTTSKPKLAMLTYDNLLQMGRSFMAVDPPHSGDDFVSFLPLAWIGEHMITLSCALQAPLTVNFPETTDTVRANLREIGPRMMFSPPRIWEDLLSSIQVRMEDSGRLKRWAFNRAIAVGYRAADLRFKKQPLPAGLRALNTLANWLVFAPLKDQLGLRRLRRAYTGGAALCPDVFRFFHAIGLNLKQIYGQTEIAGLAVLHYDGDVKFQTVGLPMPGASIKIADSGEILLKSPAVFKGYYANPTATAETLEDGWLHTGDAGYLDDDQHLIVIDRAKDVMTLSDGTKFSPQFIENKLKFSPYIHEAVVFGGEWPFVTALINIDMKNVGKWAEKRQINYTTYTDLSQKREVYGLIRAAVETANADLPPAARIARFVLLYKELDADDAELTRTRKVRRGFVAKRYAELVDALYGSQENASIETTVTYQDGRTAALHTDVHIERLNPTPLMAQGVR